MTFVDNPHLFQAKPPPPTDWCSIIQREKQPLFQ